MAAAGEVLFGAGRTFIMRFRAKIVDIGCLNHFTRELGLEKRNWREGARGGRRKKGLQRSPHPRFGPEVLVS